MKISFVATSTVWQLLAPVLDALGVLGRLVAGADLARCPVVEIPRVAVQTDQVSVDAELSEFRNDLIECGNG